MQLRLTCRRHISLHTWGELLIWRRMGDCVLIWAPVALILLMASSTAGVLNSLG